MCALVLFNWDMFFMNCIFTKINWLIKHFPNLSDAKFLWQLKPFPSVNVKLQFWNGPGSVLGCGSFSKLKPFPNVNVKFKFWNGPGYVLGSGSISKLKPFPNVNVKFQFWNGPGYVPKMRFCNRSQFAMLTWYRSRTEDQASLSFHNCFSWMSSLWIEILIQILIKFVVWLKI